MLSTLLAMLLATLLGLGGCYSDPDPRKLTSARPGVSYPLKVSVEDPARADAGSVDLVGGGDFLFVYGEGPGPAAYDVIKILADGRAQYTFHQFEPATPADRWAEWGDKPGDRVLWRRAEFRVDAATVAELRRLLGEVDFWRLDKAYYADVTDGLVRFVKVRVGGYAKGVFCNNHFPEGVQRLSLFVGQRVLLPHRGELAAAPRVRLGPTDLESPEVGQIGR